MASSKIYREGFDFIAKCFKSFQNLSDETEKASGYLDDIISNLERMASLGSSQNVKRKARDVIYQTQEVMMSICDELITLRSFRRVAVDAIWSLEGEMKFMDMEIDTFLEENVLSNYESLFKKQGIANAEELLDINIAEFESDMKPIPYKRLKKAVRKAENRRNFVEKGMKEELEQASDECDKKSKAVTSQLDDACKGLSRVMSALVDSLKDEQEIQAVFQLSCAIGGFAAFALAACSGVAFIAACSFAFAPGAILSGIILIPSAVVTGLAVMGYYSAEKAIQSIKDIIKDLENQKSQWEKMTTQTTRSWRMLIGKFLELLNMLKQNRVDVYKEEIRDIKSHMKTARKTLDKFDEDMDAFEEKIKKIALR